MKESYQKKPVGARPLRNADTLAAIKRAEYEQQQRRHVEEGIDDLGWPQPTRSSLIDDLSVIDLLNYMEQSLTSLHETISQLENHFDPVLRPIDVGGPAGVSESKVAHSNIVYRCIEVNERIGVSRDRLLNIMHRSEIQ